MTNAPPPTPESPLPRQTPAAGGPGRRPDRAAGQSPVGAPGQPSDPVGGPAPTPEPSAFGPLTDRPGADPHHDWFGHPIRPDGRRRVEPVPCPMCGIPFDRAAALDEHLRAAHGVVAHGRPLPRHGARIAAWARGLKFLPLWFVLLMNVLFTAILYLAWGNDLQLFSLGDQTAVAKTWALRLSLLPSILVLVWRTVDRVD